VSGDGGPNPSPKAKGLAVAALCVVCLVVVAVATPDGSPFDTDPSGVIAPRVPTLVGVILVVFGVLAAMGIAYLILVTAGVPDDYRARRRRWWAALAAMMALAAIVAIGVNVSRPIGEDDRGRPPREQRDESSPLRDPAARSNEALGAATALLLGLGFLGVVVAAIYRRRAWEGGDVDDQEHDALVTEVGAGIEDLRSIPDPRAAVIACYARMERFFRAEGLRRRPSDTPLEFIARALRARRVDGPSPLDLTRLFELARFSDHPVDETMRADALAALEDVRDRLEAQR
jgi:Domain of unknown function (DUF4129)